MSNDIYSYIKENFGIEITDYQFKRDYIKEPLKLVIRKKFGGLIYEKPFKEDIEYLYNQINITKIDLCRLLKIGQTVFSKWLKEWSIKKDISKRIDNTKKSNLEKYGCENVFQLDSIKEKLQKTNLEKYGVSSATQKNMNKELYEILFDKNKLKKFILENNIEDTKSLASILNIAICTLDNYIRKYDFINLFNRRKSSIEIEINQYINQYFKTETNIRGIVSKREIDIYIPELKIGIEINGNYWHSEKHQNKNYHQEKSFLFENKGIFIYHIFEYEWIEKKDKIINQLNNLLGINQEKIYARKCIIKEVDNKEKSKFLEENHLQGNDQSSIKLGLYYNNELVSLMTFVKPRFNKKYEWELSRFCSKANCNVIGGASKLFKYFINNYNPNSIISYSNIAHTKGNLYNLLGFNLDSISEPNYVWCKGYDVLSRYQCQKHKLLEQGYEGISESEIMHDRGYYKIYDCGNKVWIWDR